MKIIFLNVWGSQMQSSLVNYIDEQSPTTDVFCFQEATADMKRQCAAALAGYTEVHDYKFITEKDSFPQSIFVKNDIRILSSGTLLKDGDDRGLAIYVQLETPVSSVYICNVHGKARPNDKLDTPGRIIQSKTLIDFFNTKNEPVVIGGDFNILPQEQSIKMFATNGYRDLIDDFDIKTTRNHLSWDRFSVKLLYSDYVFLNAKVIPRSFEVCDIEVSDHLPLVVQIER